MVVNPSPLWHLSRYEKENGRCHVIRYAIDDVLHSRVETFGKQRNGSGNEGNHSEEGQNRRSTGPQYVPVGLLKTFI